jgi:hypothetical protein
MITYIIHCNMLTNRKTSIAISNRGSALNRGGDIIKKVIRRT